MSLIGFKFKILLPAFMAVLVLNVSCKTTKSSGDALGCGKEILATKSGPCHRPESPRNCPSKQRIAATLAATEKLKKQSLKPVNPTVKKETASGSSQLADGTDNSSDQKMELVVIPETKIILDETIAVGSKPVEKMAEVDRPAAIEKKPIETLAVLENKPGEKQAAIEETLVESVPLGGGMPVETESDIILVEADNANRIIVANEREVEIKGSNCVIVISGGCKNLKLSGKNNQVQCDAASFVNISGDQNTLILGVIGRSVITGNRNIISWGEGMNGAFPIAESTGQENEIGRLE